MKRTLRNILAFAVAAFALVSCNNAAKMAELAEQVLITCNPEVLEVVAGNIDADVTVNFPADYFLPKARLTVTPVLKYQGGEVAGAPFEYQGQKVTENYSLPDWASLELSPSVESCGCGLGPSPVRLG